MQFCISEHLIFPWTGLHSQRQPGTFFLIQLVINEVEPVKKKHSLIPQLIFEGQLFRNNLTIRSYIEYLVNILTFVPRKKTCTRDKHYLLKSCGRLEIIGPYPGALSYSSNNGAATNL